MNKPLSSVFFAACLFALLGLGKAEGFVFVCESGDGTASTVMVLADGSHVCGDGTEWRDPEGSGWDAFHDSSGLPQDVDFSGLAVQQAPALEPVPISLEIHAPMITAPIFTIPDGSLLESEPVLMIQQHDSFGVVPEPSSAMLGIISLILLWRRQTPTSSHPR